MSLRLVQVVLPASKRSELSEALHDVEADRWWTVELRENFQVTNVLTRADLCEDLIDALAERFDGSERFRVTLLPAEATYPKLPEPEKPDESEPDVEPENGPKKIKPLIGRVSREELEEDLVQDGMVNRLFVTMTALSTVVACIGLMKDSPAIIIGAMVIAPLLGPNMALALGSTLGDVKLIKRAATANAVGVGAALLMSAAVGLITSINAESAEFDARASVDYFDIPLALASGAAGALAATTGAGSTIVGVMVAVALLPPTAACGMMLGAGEWSRAFGALQMLLINVVGINLAATGVFLLQGIRPNTWWGAERARSASTRAIIAWALLLVILAALLFFTNGHAQSVGELLDTP
ncbi:MAG: TIGR00341 family protein [Phycisphaerales bacterium]